MLLRLQRVLSKAVRHYCVIDPRPIISQYYQIPEKYRNSFYCANASLVENTNWHIHRAYEIVFTELVQSMKMKERGIKLPILMKKVRTIIAELEESNEVLEVRFPVKVAGMGSVTLDGFRVHHGINYIDLPCLGGK